MAGLRLSTTGLINQRTHFRGIEAAVRHDIGPHKPCLAAKFIGHGIRDLSGSDRVAACDPQVRSSARIGMRERDLLTVRRPFIRAMRRGIVGWEPAVDALRVGATNRAACLQWRHPDGELRIFVPDKCDGVAVGRPFRLDFVGRSRSQATRVAGLDVENIDVAVARSVGGKGDTPRVRRPGRRHVAVSGRSRRKQPRCSSSAGWHDEYVFVVSTVVVREQRIGDKCDEPAIG